MSSTHEESHAINIANFKKIIELCTNFGEIYNPVNEDITIASMTTKWTAVNTLHIDYLLVLDNTKLPIDIRENLYVSLVKQVARTLRLYESTKAIKEAKETAKSLVRKITGSNVRIPKLADGVTPNPNYVSNSHQSYIQKADNFVQLINVYKNDENYASNEADLNITNLEATLTAIITANDNVDDATMNAMTKRAKRNHGLYDRDTGLIDISIACKKYVQGLFGIKSPEAMVVTGIRLKRFMKF